MWQVDEVRDRAGGPQRCQLRSARAAAHEGGVDGAQHGPRDGDGRQGRREAQQLQAGGHGAAGDVGYRPAGRWPSGQIHGEVRRRWWSKWRFFDGLGRGMAFLSRNQASFSLEKRLKGLPGICQHFLACERPMRGPLHGGHQDVEGTGH